MAEEHSNLKNTDQTVKHIPRGEMAVALTTCCLFDSAARISFNRVIPMFIDDGSPRLPRIVGVLKHYTLSNTSSIENKEYISAICAVTNTGNIRLDKETIRTALYMRISVYSCVTYVRGEKKIARDI